MMESQALDTPVASERKIQLVDCDVHPSPTTRHEVASYLSRRSHERAERLGAFGGRRLMAGWGSHYLFGMGARCDAEPEEGETNLDQLRRQLLDLYDIDVGVLNSGNMFDRSFPELAADGARATNDWLTDQYLDREPRLRGSLVVPWEWPELAVREIEERASDPRWVQVMMPGEAIEPLGARKYWPIYEAATAHGLPVATHIGAYDPHHGTGWPTFTFEHHVGFVLSTRRQLLNMCCDGLFEGVPGVRVVLVEGGVSWAASLRWALDSTWELLRGDVQLDRPPSEYLDECVWFTTQPIEEPDDPAEFARTIGYAKLENRILFSTDYPHWDFDSPTQALPRALSADLRQRIFAGNACALYGLE